MPHAYTLHIPLEVDLDEEGTCQAYASGLKPCRSKAHMKVAGTYLCYLHAGAFLTYGRLLITTGHEMVSLDHEAYRKAKDNADR